MWKTKGGCCIYQSEHAIRVYQNIAYRWLTFNSPAIQTMIYRRTLTKPILSYIKPLILAASLQPDTSCLLGLGGGGVAHALAPYLKSSSLLAVEQNLEVIEVAHRYFMIDNLPQLTVLHQDAQHFVHKREHCYQHVMVDLFDAHTFPKQCNSYEFFAQCRQLLRPQGILAVNLANLKEQLTVFNHIREAFQQRTVSFVVKQAANVVVIACNDTSILPLFELLKSSHQLKKWHWEPQWGYLASLK